MLFFFFFFLSSPLFSQKPCLSISSLRARVCTPRVQARTELFPQREEGENAEEKRKNSPPSCERRSGDERVRFSFFFPSFFLLFDLKTSTPHKKMEERKKKVIRKNSHARARARKFPPGPLYPPSFSSGFTPPKRSRNKKAKKKEKKFSPPTPKSLSRHFLSLSL